MLGTIIGFFIGGFIGVCFGVISSGNSYEKGVRDGMIERQKQIDIEKGYTNEPK